MKAVKYVAVALVAVLFTAGLALAGAPLQYQFKEEDVTNRAIANEDVEYRFLCSTIGDSLTGFSALQSVFFDRLNNPDFPYRSIPGYTRVAIHSLNGGVTSAILSMINRYDLGAGEGADFVIIMAGTNDIDYSRGDDLDNLTNGIVANVQAMIESVLGGQTEPDKRPAVIVAGIPGFTDADAESRAKHINEQLKNRLQKLDIFTDETFYSLYDANAGTANRDLMSDNKHPNRDGFYRLAEAWYNAVDALYDPTRFQNNPYLHKMGWYFQRH